MRNSATAGLQTSEFRRTQKIMETRSLIVLAHRHYLDTVDVIIQIYCEQRTNDVVSNEQGQKKFTGHISQPCGFKPKYRM